MKPPQAAHSYPDRRFDDARFSHAEIYGREPEYLFQLLTWFEGVRASAPLPSSQLGSLSSLPLSVEAIEFEGDELQWVQLHGDDIARTLREYGVPESDWWHGWTDAQRNEAGELPESAGRVWIGASWGMLHNASDGSISKHSLIS